MPHFRKRGVQWALKSCGDLPNRNAAYPPSLRRASSAMGLQRGTSPSLLVGGSGRWLDHLRTSKGSLNRNFQPIRSQAAQIVVQELHQLGRGLPQMPDVGEDHLFGAH